MTGLSFWFFMLVLDLLIPACMLYFGWRFLKKPPKNINNAYGYRSTRSMRNQEAWDFVQAYSGRFWFRTGWLALAASFVWMALLFGKKNDVVGLSAGILAMLQMVPFLAVIPATEQALKREFDAFGRKK